MLVSEVDTRLSLVAVADSEVAKSEVRSNRLHQSILKQAFEGTLVPQDPTDEPASVLLERLEQTGRLMSENGEAARLGPISWSPGEGETN